MKSKGQVTARCGQSSRIPRRNDRMCRVPFGAACSRFFVTQGLLGAADLDFDEMVGVDELFRFTATHVSEWVTHATGGTSSQTPTLTWGGGEIANRRAWPNVLPVTKLKEDRKQFDLPAAILAAKTTDEEPDKSDGEKKQVADATDVDGVDESSEEKTAKELADKSNKVNVSSSNDAKDSAASEEGGNDNPRDEEAVESKEKSKARASEPKPRNFKSLTSDALLAAAWQLRDRFDSFERFPLRPVDYAPHLWRKVNDELLRYEQMYRAGILKGDESSELPKLRSLTEGLEALSFNTATDLPLSHVARQIQETRPDVTPFVKQSHSLALSEFLAQRFDVEMDKKPS